MPTAPIAGDTTLGEPRQGALCNVREMNKIFQEGVCPDALHQRVMEVLCGICGERPELMKEWECALTISEEVRDQSLEPRVTIRLKKDLLHPEKGWICFSASGDMTESDAPTSICGYNEAVLLETDGVIPFFESMGYQFCALYKMGISQFSSFHQVFVRVCPERIRVSPLLGTPHFGVPTV